MANNTESTPPSESPPPPPKEPVPAPTATTTPSSPPPSAPSPPSTTAATPTPTPETTTTPVKPPRKEFPNRELRSKSGGTPKGKMTPEELEAKMAAMRIQNEKLKAKREETEADEKAYVASREAELKAAKEKKEAATAAAKAAKQAEVDKRERAVAHQASINAEREKVAQAKLKKVEGRAWDKEKLDQKKESASAGTGGSGNKTKEELNYPSKTARRRSPPLGS